MKDYEPNNIIFVYHVLGCEQLAWAGNWWELIQDYEEVSGKGYMCKVHVKYPKGVHKLLSELQYSPERMKNDNCETKLVCNLYSKKNCIMPYT